MNLFVLLSWKSLWKARALFAVPASLCVWTVEVTGKGMRKNETDHPGCSCPGSDLSSENQPAIVIQLGEMCVP